MPSRPPLPRRPRRLPPLPWLGALLMAAALMLRMAVPAGWMPAGPGADGGARFAIAICDGTGGHLQPLALAGHQAPASHDAPDGGHAPCPFAVCALAAIAGAAPALAAAMAPAAPARATVPLVAPPPAPAGRWRPPGRAPPSLA